MPPDIAKLPLPEIPWPLAVLRLPEETFSVPLSLTGLEALIVEPETVKVPPTFIVKVPVAFTALPLAVMVPLMLIAPEFDKVPEEAVRIPLAFTVIVVEEENVPPVTANVPLASTVTVPEDVREPPVAIVSVAPEPLLLIVMFLTCRPPEETTG